MRKLAAMMAVVLMVVLAGCEEAANLPEQGSDETISVPPTIIGKVVVFTITEPLNACSAPAGTTGRMWFVDENTIRAVRDDGSFDFPTTSWEYERTGGNTGRIEAHFQNGSWTIWGLVFTSNTMGTAEARDGGVPCPAHAETMFVLEDAPG